MREIAIEVGTDASPIRVVGTICPSCPGNAAIFPPSAYRLHAQAHKDKPRGRVCTKCHKDLPWDRFPRTDTNISLSCYDCRPNGAMRRGRPRGYVFKKTGIKAPRVWGPGQDEVSDGEKERK